MSELLGDILDSILTEATANGWRIEKFLNDGADDAFIRSSENEIGLVFPEQLFELYKWRNGTRMKEGDDMDVRHFFPGFIFLAFEDAVDIYNSIRDDLRWNPRWFPVFGNGGGDFYAVVCDPSSQDFGALVGFIVDEAEQPIEFESISSMMKTVRDCFSSNVYYVSAEGFLEADDLSAAIVAKKHNPSLEIYRDIQ